MAWTAAEQVAAKPSLRLDVNGVDLAPFVASWRCRFPFNGKITWDLTAKWTPAGQNWADVPSAFTLPGTGDFDGLIRHHGFDDRRLLTYALTVAGMTFPPVKLYPLSPKFDGRTLSWPGEDRTAALERASQQLGDILLDQGTVVWAHAAMLDMGERAGIKVDCRFPNFRLRVLRRGRGRLLDWMDTIARVYQAGRRWEGDVLVYEPARVDADVVWRFRDHLNIQIFETEERFDEVSNSWTITRLQPQGNILGEQEASGPRAIGRVGSITLDPPSRSAVAEIDANTELLNFTYFDEADNITIGNGGPIYVHASPAARVEFSSKPITEASVLPPGFGNMTGNKSAFTPRFHVVFAGTGRGNQPGNGAFNITKEDLELQAIFGVVPADSNLESDIIPDEQVANDCGEAIKRENTRKLYRCFLGTPYLNPFIQPGQRISVTDFQTGQNQTIWFVDAVLHNLAGKWSMGLECSRGLDA